MRTFLYAFLAVLAWAHSGLVLANTDKVVSVAAVTSGLVSPTMMVTGRVQSRASTSLSAGVSGKLHWVAEPGTQVEAGNVVARLEDRPQQLAVKQLQAKIHRAKISVSRLQREFERYQALYDTQAISDTQQDKVQSDLDLAQADLQLLEIELEQAQEDLRKTRVVAPFDGVITQRFEHQGADISPNQSVVELVNTNALEIAVYGPLEYSALVQHVAELAVTGKDKQQRLPIRAVVPVSDKSSQTFVTYLEIPAARVADFQIGELVSVAVPTAVPSEQYLVPRDAIVLGEKISRVYLLDEENKAVAITVELGEGQGDYITVEGALSVGQQVIVRGAETLQHGQTVKVLGEDQFPLSTLKT